MSSMNHLSTVEICLFVAREILIQVATLVIGFLVGWYLSDFIIDNWRALALCATAVLFMIWWST